MAKRADNDGKAVPPWKTRMEKMKRENRCVTCGVDKDLVALWRTLDEEARKDVIEFIAQEIENAEVAAKAAKVEAEETEETEAESVLPEAESPGDPFKGRMGEEAEAEEPPTVAEATVATTQVEETAREKKNRLRREKRAAAKKA